MHQNTTVAAVLEAPKREDVRHGRPLSGLDGAEWDRALKANGLKRPMIDLFFVTACASKDGWKKMEAQLRRRRKSAQKKMQKAGMSAAEAKRIAEEDLPHPADCCAPYLQTMLASYGYVIPLGSTPAQRVLDTAASMSNLEGDMREMKASRLTWQAFDWTQSKEDWIVKVVSTYDPGYVKHSPKVRPQFYATLGKAFRWFNNALHWREPVVSEQPTADELREWLSVPAPFWVYDYETDGINVLDIGVRCLAIATPDLNEYGEPTMPWEEPTTLARSIGIGIMGTDRPGRRYYSPSGEEEIKDILREFFSDPTKVKVGHNAGYFDRQVTEHWLGVTPRPTRDTLFDARFTHPDLPKGLKPTGRRLTDVHKWETSESGEKNSGSKVLDKERLTYCEYDTVVNARIVEPLRRSADENGAARPLPDWAKPVSWPAGRPWDLRHLDHARQEMCVQMHQNGVYVDQAKAAILTDKFERVAKDLYQQLQDLGDAAGVKKQSNRDFNPGSFDQVRNLLYEQWDLGVPYGMDAREFYTTMRSGSFFSR
jgi:uracil-DNA glycosylase